MFASARVRPFSDNKRIKSLVQIGKSNCYNSQIVIGLRSFWRIIHKSLDFTQVLFAHLTDMVFAYLTDMV